MRSFILFILQAKVIVSSQGDIHLQRDQCLGEPEDEPSFQVCDEVATENFYECINSCKPGDSDCYVQCNRDLADQVEKCPCKSGCPNGCPCPEYECPSSPLDAVLVLSRSPYYPNKPLVINNRGQSRVPNFNFDRNTYVYASCGVTFQNEMWIYGGDTWDDPRQISKVQDCFLKRIGSLPFDHNLGACGAGGGYIYLCFNWTKKSDAKVCRRSINPESGFEAVSETHDEHRMTRAAASDDVLFTVGSYRESVRAETYNHHDNANWNAYDEYPFGDPYIFYGPIVYDNDSFWVFGGYIGLYTKSVVARFDMSTKTWSKAGSLQKERYANGAIKIGSDFMVIGGDLGKGAGDDPLPTEICTPNENKDVECKKQGPSLFMYAYYPEVFNVPYDFCS